MKDHIWNLIIVVIKIFINLIQVIVQIQELIDFYIYFLLEWLIIILKVFLYKSF
jgi:hypothetical protein